METLHNAIKVFGLKHGVYGLLEIKAIYRQLAMIHHPDRSGNNETMQIINKAFDEINAHFIKNDSLTIEEDNSKINFTFMQELKIMQGVIIEVCGYWVWLSGNTIAYKDSIKSLGFRFSGSKKMWYWSPNIDILKYRRGTSSIKNIRHRYGSKIIATNEVEKLA